MKVRLKAQNDFEGFISKEKLTLLNPIFPRYETACTLLW